MSETATKLLEQLLQLPQADRLLIADRLWESLGDSEKQAVIDESLDDPEFQAELQRRLESVANGTAEMIPWEQAREEMRAELERRRAARENGS
jgi:putative addiction module component (TIGR02574 family)